ncbi:MAG TPA: thiamine phosphate synthase [Terriglobia bacterium]|nr:thiamine phosphate synthase [Terriglobia bacterium]
MRTLPRLYAIADAAFGDPVSLAAALFEGGARLVQLRNKDAAPATLLAQTEAILLAAPPGALVIVNDHVDVALIARAAGAHVGQDDLPPEAARHVLGPEAIIGVSTHNLEQALAADRAPVDYIAVGPVFETRHKASPAAALGLETLALICRSVTRPVVAIGGITLSSAPAVYQCGARSIAAIGDLVGAPDIAGRVRQWLEVA